MNRTFEDRKPTKVYAQSKENKAIIKALNNYGRVPEQWELLEEIERLKAREKECIDKYLNMSKYASEMEGKYITEKYIIDELEKFFKNAYDNEVRPLNDRKISVWTICLEKLKKLKEGK